jgi:hypothetical protein
MPAPRLEYGNMRTFSFASFSLDAAARQLLREHAPTPPNA